MAEFRRRTTRSKCSGGDRGMEMRAEDQQHEHAFHRSRIAQINVFAGPKPEIAHLAAVARIERLRNPTAAERPRNAEGIDEPIV